MRGNWTFGTKVSLGFAAAVVFSLVIAVVAIYALRDVVSSKDSLLTVNSPMLVDAQSLSAATAQRIGAALRFVITKEQRHLDEMAALRSEMLATLARLRSRVRGDEERRLVSEIERNESEQQGAIDRLVALRRGDAAPEAIERACDEDVFPKRLALRQSVNAFTAEESRILDEAKEASSRTASSAITLVVGIGIVAVVFAGLVAVVLARTLGRQIGSSVGQVQSSSAELQSAANQQATSAKEQATAMKEITTTVTELLATSRQIMESAQRVARIAEQTAVSARAGETTVARGNESVANIRRQVDLIVNHMLELGRKSQQIGGVLEIVSELAEQTNILAINATIEAAGAGEAGKRFAVVAEEIRKLADRVAGSTKEIRGLIEEVRGAVNTTVMTTEGGSKAVDLGARQFAEVAAAFGEIASHVATTTEVAKEIELSTKQQASAVEQVNLTIASVAQASKETESSTSQTLQTASQLAVLSRDLLRLVKSQAA